MIQRDPQQNTLRMTGSIVFEDDRTRHGRITPPRHSRSHLFAVKGETPTIKVKSDASSESIQTRGIG